MTLLALSIGALAATPTSTSLRAKNAWIRWLPANLPAAGYVAIENDGGAPARLTGASSPDYGRVMLHRSQTVNGVEKMTMVASMDIPAQGKAALAPGGYHLMLSEPTHPIKPGDTVRVTLRFAGGLSLQADFPVRPANASGPAS